jgi:hypothetical protein
MTPGGNDRLQYVHIHDVHSIHNENKVVSPSVSNISLNVVLESY